MTKARKPGTGYTQADLEAVSDNPELTAEELANARHPSEVLPKGMFEALAKKGRGPQKRPTKELVSVRLDRDLLDRYRASGDGWQSRMNADLRKASGL